MDDNIDIYESDSRIRRRMVGFFVLLTAIFPILALVTYNWRDMPQLCLPPLSPAENLVGPLGDHFAYHGYMLVGLAIWIVPLLWIIEGLVLMCGKSFHPGRRMVALLLFTISLTCLLQLTGRMSIVASILHAINMPDAGGAVGYLLVDKSLSKLLSPFGTAILLSLILIFSAVLAIGVRTLIKGVRSMVAWSTDREDENIADDAEATEQMLAAKEAAAQAARERLEAKRRAAEEKAAERERKRQEKELARQEKEAARQRLLEESEPDLFSQPEQQPIPPPTPTPVPVPTPTAEEPVKEDKGPYVLPPPEVVLKPVPPSSAEHGDVAAMEQRLIDTLKVFQIEVAPAFRVTGPVVTQYALTPAPGVRAERIASLAANLQMALEAKSLRILAPIPGKNAVGIEVPNLKPASVCFREIIDGKLWQEKSVWPENAQPKFHLPLLLGKDAAGNDLVVDLTKMPHLLVAGATGQGKSVCLNSIINGLLMCRTPEQLRLIMVDPKRVEFTSYNRLPHLLVPVINDTKKVVFGLRWAVVEMERRLKEFSRAGCRNIVDFNTRKTVAQPDMFGGETALGNDADMPKTEPYIVIIIDEVAEVMQAAQKEVDPLIARLTALARATGIHLILATQRPDTKVITGTIKSNIPGRIAFKTSSAIDSRTILDEPGSEDLIGKGDMLIRMSDGILQRAQGSFISDDEINNIINFIGEHANVQFDEKFVAHLNKIKDATPEDELDSFGDDSNEKFSGDNEGDERPSVASDNKASGLEADYLDALDVLQRTGRASTSHLQRRMGLGYNRAAKIMDMLEERGVISAQHGAGPRQILLDPEAIIALIKNGGISDVNANDTAITDEPTSAENPMPQDDAFATLDDPMVNDNSNQNL